MKNNYKVGEKDTRPWGRWEVVHAGSGFVVKEIGVNAGGILSLQKHKHRSEHWIVVAGSGTVTLDGNKKTVAHNQSVFIPAGAWHRMENNGSEELVFIEIQTGKILDENDIERKDDKYGRTS